MKVLMILALAFLAGCASSSDVERLQAQIDSLQPQVVSLSAGVAEAKQNSALALQKASAAEAAAVKAAESCAEINTKLDRLFKHAKLK